MLLEHPEHVKMLSDLLVHRQLPYLSPTPVDLRKIWHLLSDEDRIRLVGHAGRTVNSDTTSSDSSESSPDTADDKFVEEELFDDKPEDEDLTPEEKKKQEELEKELIKLHYQYNEIGDAE